MQELEKVLGIVTKVLALLAGWPIWAKVVAVVAVIAVAVWLITTLQGEGGGE